MEISVPPRGGDPPDGDPVMHQRLYEFVLCSIGLLLLRLLPVKRWIAGQNGSVMHESFLRTNDTSVGR